jgi:hypothetical protein
LQELKTKSDAVEAKMQLQLNTTETARYTGTEEAPRNGINREIKQKAQALTFNINSSFHLIARFKAKLCAGLMKKEGQLTSIEIIKAKPMQVEAMKSKINEVQNNSDNSSQNATLPKK